jgi:hypothetical protein
VDAGAPDIRATRSGFRPVSLDAVNFLSADVRGAVGPYLNVFLVTQQHWSQSEVGLVTMIGGLAALCGRPREWQALFGLAEHIKARQSGPGTAADLAFGIAIALSRIDLRGPDPLLSVT